MMRILTDLCHRALGYNEPWDCDCRASIYSSYPDDCLLLLFIDALKVCLKVCFLLAKAYLLLGN